MKNISVKIEPEEEMYIFSHARTVYQILNRLKLKPEEVLVIRGEELLTIDRFLQQDDSIIIRKVASRG